MALPRELSLFALGTAQATRISTCPGFTRNFPWSGIRPPWEPPPGGERTVEIRETRGGFAKCGWLGWFQAGKALASFGKRRSLVFYYE